MFTPQFPLILRRGVLAIMVIAMTLTTTDTSRGLTNCERLITLAS
jgi:hypothetical protein